MVEDEKRRRAPAMTLEQRREAIVASTLPLLIEHVGAVSTSQIAAAGIAEGTVFRAFKDKQELLVACMRAGLNSDEEVARIDGVDPALPLVDRLAEGVRAVTGYLNRIWQVGQARRRPASAARRCTSASTATSERTARRRPARHGR